MTPQHTKETKT